MKSKIRLSGDWVIRDWVTRISGDPDVLVPDYRVSG